MVSLLPERITGNLASVAFRDGELPTVVIVAWPDADTSTGSGYQVRRDPSRGSDSLTRQQEPEKGPRLDIHCAHEVRKPTTTGSPLMRQAPQNPRQIPVAGLRASVAQHYIKAYGGRPSDMATSAAS